MSLFMASYNESVSFEPKTQLYSFVPLQTITRNVNLNDASGTVVVEEFVNTTNRVSDGTLLSGWGILQRADITHLRINGYLLRVAIIAGYNFYGWFVDLYDNKIDSPYPTLTVLTSFETGYIIESSPTLYEFPPSGMTAGSTQFTAGTYIATASRQDGSYPAFRAFNKLIDDAGWYTNAFDYNPTTGAYIGTAAQTLGGINGDWLKLQLPSAMILKSYSLTNRNNANDGQICWKFAVLGSNNNSTWTIVDDKLTTGLPWVNIDNQTITVTDFTNTTAYLYYAIVATFTAGGLGLTNGGILSINEWRLFSNQPVITEFPITAMTANTSVSCVATASSEDTGRSFFAWRAFNQNLGDNWAQPDPARYAISAQGVGGAYTHTPQNTTITNTGTFVGEWLQIQLPTAITPTGYKLTNRAAIRQNPFSWVLAGSTNGTTWTTIDVESGTVIFNGSTQSTITYAITDSSTAYTFYRMIFTQTDAFDGYIALAEWRMLGY